MYVVSSDVRYGYLEDDQKVGLTGPLKEIVMMAVQKGEKLLDEVKQKASKTDIDVKTEVIMGYTSVAKSIVEYAEERNFDLIVIGTRGMTGIKKMLLGRYCFLGSNICSLPRVNSKIDEYSLEPNDPEKPQWGLVS